MDTSIEVVCGPGSTLEGRRFSFATCPVSLGRSAENDIGFDAHGDRMVSGRHAELRFENGTIRLHDLGSSNGTYVNGTRATAPVTLSFGDRIVLGKDGATLQVLSPLLQRPTTTTKPAGLPAKQTQTAPAGPGHHTIMAMVSDAAAHERRRSRPLVLSLTIVTMILGAGLIAGATWLYRGGVKDTMQDVARREARIAAKEEATQTARGITRSIDRRIKEANRGFREVFPRVERSVYPVFRRTKMAGTERTLAGGGTCWVVGPGVLATNAHVAANHRPGKSKLVIRVSDPARELVIQRVEIHPGYALWRQLQSEYRPIDPGKLTFMTLIPACDVALMWCRPEDAQYLGPPLEIAPTPQLHNLARGTPAAFLGFPVEGTVVGSLERSKAASEIGTISQVFDYFLENNESEFEQLVTYNLKGEGGASGSPVFDRNGNVIAVHSAGNFKFIGGHRISQGSTNFGQRADLVGELLASKAETRTRELNSRWRQRLVGLWSQVRDSKASITAISRSAAWPSGRGVATRLLKSGSLDPGQQARVRFELPTKTTWFVAAIVTGGDFGKLGLRGSFQATASSWIALSKRRLGGRQQLEVFQPSSGDHPVHFELWLMRPR